MTERRKRGPRRRHGEGWPHYSPEYISWKKMKQRCRYRGQQGFAYWGGRGIQVHAAFERFEDFLLHVGRKPTSRHTLDRIDSDGHYAPGNVRWATPKEQAANRRPRKRASGGSK